MPVQQWKRKKKKKDTITLDINLIVQEHPVLLLPKYQGALSQAMDWRRLAMSNMHRTAPHSYVRCNKPKVVTHFKAPTQLYFTSFSIVVVILSSSYGKCHIHQRQRPIHLRRAYHSYPRVTAISQDRGGCGSR